MSWSNGCCVSTMTLLCQVIWVHIVWLVVYLAAIIGVGYMLTVRHIVRSVWPVKPQRSVRRLRWASYNLYPPRRTTLSMLLWTWLLIYQLLVLGLIAFIPLLIGCLSMFTLCHVLLQWPLTIWPSYSLPMSFVDMVCRNVLLVTVILTFVVTSGNS